MVRRLVCGSSLLLLGMVLLPNSSQAQVPVDPLVSGVAQAMIKAAKAAGIKEEPPCIKQLGRVIKREVPDSIVQIKNYNVETLDSMYRYKVVAAIDGVYVKMTMPIQYYSSEPTALPRLSRDGMVCWVPVRQAP